MSWQIKAGVLALALATAAHGMGQGAPAVSGKFDDALQTENQNLTAQQDKTAPAQKDKAKQKEKEKPAPLALSDLLPQEQLNLAGEALPQAPEMLGDVPPFGIRVTVPPILVPLPPLIVTKIVQNADGTITVIRETVPRAPAAVPGTGGPAFLPAGGGGFKIADNNSAMPQDRVYFAFNFFNDFLASTNSRLGTGIQHMSIYRESVGMEKTFLDRNASVGLVLPLNTLSAESPVANVNGTHTALGDLSLFGRYALFRDVANNNWISGGLALTVPSGPSNFAGISAPSPVPHTTIFQPFGSYLWNFGNFYLQGFTSLATPTAHSAGPILIFNDLGIGYFVYRAPAGGGLLTGVAPAFEVHVADPLNYRGAVTASNPFGAFDIVDLGVGLNVLLGGRSRLGIGVVAPVTGPRPFDVEALFQLRIGY